MTKPREKTREELTAEIEESKKKIRQFENREKIIKQKLSVEERKARTHRLCKRGGFMESLVPELIAMPDEDAKAFLRLALTSEPAQEFLKKRAEDGKKKIRQLENREKVLRQKLSQEERRTRSHRLIVRGAVFESIVPEAKTMTDEEAAAFLRLALTSEEARAYLKKRTKGGKSE